MGDIFLFTVKLLCSVFGCLLLLRAWLRYMGTPANDPISLFTYGMTEWAVRQASTIIKKQKNIDWPSIFVAYLVAVLYQVLHWLVGAGNFGIFLFILGSAVLVIYWAIELAMWVALLSAVASWFDPAGKVYSVLSYLSYPYLKPFRRILPVWRNIDFAPLVFFLLATIVLSIIAPFT